MLLTVFEAAKIMGKKPRHIRYLIDMGYLEGIKPGRAMRVSMGAIREYYAAYGDTIPEQKEAAPKPVA
ncbi:helix-turn-helix domain-containing protein [Brucepastera parasyntrophica]|uniref:helix-turn-helix domain-containing protein n=1 Tax=Brucepastera parasyntrophica TaxID=2880008 RepID=UPI00210D9B19|nr:helix-turn-helix domain-containing protein [Brucepastera parasyntrophica]ULQ60815.1 helix-turn-helix domain-containing protein [Brucepastera parasyntrophica]